jgi:ribosomal protein L18
MAKRKKRKPMALYGYLSIYQFKHKHRRVVVETTRKYYMHQIVMEVADIAVCLTCKHRVQLRRDFNHDYYAWLEHGHG